MGCDREARRQDEEQRQQERRKQEVPVEAPSPRRPGASAGARIRGVFVRVRMLRLPLREEQLLHIPIPSSHHLHHRRIRLRWHYSPNFLDI